MKSKKSFRFIILALILCIMSTVMVGVVYADENSQWESFRGNEYNMGITQSKTPIDEEETYLKWSKKFGDDWGKAPSVQIIADNALITMCGNTLYKLDLKNGDILSQATMVASANYGYTPPTYANGMIFCPLKNGTIQAFDCKTLQSLWVYKDELGGQSLSPISYSDGYIYTGFWNSEIDDANFVAIDVTDEDKSATDEKKSAVWKHTQKGGFYWAGSVVVGDCVIVGTDNGSKEEQDKSKLYSFNKKTGKIISEFELVGDQRSSISYDKQSSKIYFTTKVANIYCATVDEKSGELSDLKVTEFTGESTSTPVVYKDKVYFAIGGGIDKAGTVVVADKNSLDKIYSFDVKGYPQSSILLSTGYEDDDSSIYLYFTYNSKPSGILRAKVDPNSTTSSGVEVVEIYDALGYSDYGIASIICSSDGTLYYKNDSGVIFCVGRPVADDVDKLIENIDSENIETIQIARNSYNALSDEEKSNVKKLDSLLSAEKDANIQIESEVAITIDGVEYSVPKSVAEIMSKIEEVAKNQDITIEEVAEIYKQYNSLKDKEKNKVANFSKLDDMTKKFVDSSKEENFDIVGLDWNIKPTLNEDVQQDVSEIISKSIGSNKIVKLFEINLNDIVEDDEIYELEKPVTIKIKVDNLEKFNSYKVVYCGSDGKIEYIDCEIENDELIFKGEQFPYYALIGGNGEAVGDLDNLQNNNNFMWLWIALIVVGIVVVIVVFILKNKHKK